VPESIEVAQQSVANELKPINESERKTLRVLADIGGEATSTAWLQRAGLPDKTFHNHRKVLFKNGYVEQVDGKRHWYRMSATAKALPLASQSTASTVAAATATPPMGVAEAAELLERE
jgi:DNA-binding IclR family transcriptional regulator